MKEKILFAWSGGKDSALALHELLKDNTYDIEGILTTVTEDYDRTSMHGVRSVLLKKQADSLGLKLKKMLITKNDSFSEYESKMKEAMLSYKDKRVNAVAFGDIHLDDLRKHREEKLKQVGMKAIFPIWKRDTKSLASSFIDAGFRAVITCIDSKVLDKKFAGREFNEEFLSDLPKNVDPCGENGEFHSFVYAGPIFKERIKHTKGEIVLRDKRYYYCDLLA